MYTAWAWKVAAIGVVPRHANACRRGCTRMQARLLNRFADDVAYQLVWQ